MNFTFRIFSICLAFIGFSASISAQAINTMTINSPASIAGTYSVIAADFGDLSATPVTGDLLAGMDDTDPTGDACTDLVNDVTGFIGLIDRGSCEFGTKVLNAEEAGAIAVLVCNNQPGPAAGMGPGAEGGSVTVFSAMASQDDCNTIKAELASGPVNVSFSFMLPPCETEYDSTVVWGAGGEGEFNGGLGDWSTAGVTAETDLWIWDAEGNNNGALVPGSLIESPSLCNGAALMDFDFLSTGGDGDVLNSLGFPYPLYTSTLISPTIDLSGVDSPTLEFYQYNLPLNGVTSFAFSIDDGFTWSEEIEITTENVLTASSNNVVGTELKSYSLPDVADQAEVRIRFTSTGDFYFCMIDDVIIRNLNIVDVQLNENWYATAPNFKTPKDQVDQMAFLVDIENTGGTDITNVVLEVSVTNDSGTVVHSDNLEYGTIEAGFLDENRVVANTFTPPAEVASYVGNYTVVSDNDENDTNNSIDFTFEVTENLFAKVESESVAGAEYLGDRATPNEFFESYGNYYYVPNGAGKVASKVNFGVVIPDLPASPGFITVNLFQWIDLNEDMMCDPTERFTLSHDDILISDELDAASLRNMEVILTPTDDQEQVTLADDSHYIAMVSFRPLQTTGSQYRILAANTAFQTNFSHGPMSLALSSEFGINRYGTMFQIGTDNTPEDIENRTFEPNIFWSAYIPLTIVEEGSSTNNLDSNVSLQIFPNPASDQIVVDLKINETAKALKYELITLEGKVVLSQKDYNVISGKYNLDITSVPAGAYMLSVSSDKGVNTQKVIVTK